MSTRFGLGKQVISDNIPDAIDEVGLNWDVVPKKMQSVDGWPTSDNVRGLYRNDNQHFLSNVTSNYQVLQNSRAFDWFQPFMDTGKLSLDSAGELNGGKRVWILAKFKGDPIDLGGGDSIQKYILASNSHDGKTSAGFALTPIRPGCYNMFPGILRNAFSRVRHSSFLEAGLEGATKVLNDATIQFNDISAKFIELSEKVYTEKELDVYIKSVLGVTMEEEKVKTRTKNLIEKIKGHVVSSPGNTGDVGKTWWGAFNGVTYYYTHEYGRSVNNRMNNLWFGTNSVRTRNAFNLAVTMSEEGYMIAA